MAQADYVVEISMAKNKTYISAVKVFDKDENFTIELERNQAHNIMKEFMNDCKLIAHNLRIMNRRLVLLNPRAQGKTRKQRKLYK